MSVHIRAFALTLVGVAAALVVPRPCDQASAKETESFARGLLFTVEREAADRVHRPDPADFRRVSATLGSPRTPRGQWILGKYQITEPKSDTAVTPMPDGQWMALVTLENLAKDLVNKDGKVVLKAARYLNIGLPAMDKEGRAQAVTWANGLRWNSLDLILRVAVPNAAHQFEYADVYRNQVRIPESDWAVLSLGGSAVIYIEPLRPPKDWDNKAGDGAGATGDVEADSRTPGANASGDQAANNGADSAGGPDKELRMIAWIWRSARLEPVSVPAQEVVPDSGPAPVTPPDTRPQK